MWLVEPPDCTPLGRIRCNAAGARRAPPPTKALLSGTKTGIDSRFIGGDDLYMALTVPSAHQRANRAHVLRLPLWGGYAAVSAVLFVVFFMVESGSRAQNGMYTLASAGVFAALVVGVLRYRPVRWEAWLLFAGGFLCWTAGDLYWGYYAWFPQTQAPYPSPADAAYLAGYPLLIAGAFAITRGWGRLKTTDLLDCATVAIPATLLVLQFLVRPLLAIDGDSAYETVLITVGPVGDLILFIALMQLGFRSRLSNFAVRCFIVGMAFEVATDFAYSYLNLKSAYTSGTWIDAGWLIAFTLFAVAALHPSMAKIKPVSREQMARFSGSRAALLTAAVLVSPVAFIVTQVWHDHINLLGLGVAGVLTTLLVGWRVAQLQRNLDRSASLLNATLEATPDGMVVIDGHRQMTHWNERFVELWGLPAEFARPSNRDKVMTHVFSQLTAADVAVMSARESELASSPHARSFDMLRLPDSRVIECHSNPRILDGAFVGRVWYFKDVTARDQLEQDLRKAQRLEAVGQLAGGIAHDFNNLLMAVSGYASVIKADPSAPTVAEDAAEIERASGRAAELTKQLLAFGRKQQLHLEPVELASVVEGVEKLLRSVLREHGRLDLRLARGAYAQLDRTQIEQVLLNLALNSRDSMSAGGTVTIRVFEAGPNAMLEFQDTGSGMDEETLNRAMEPFFTTKPIGKGSGLGLSTAVGIVEQSGGTLAITSEPGVGTCVSISLPRPAYEEAA
jgi:PAS domain S-box-containing protein